MISIKAHSSKHITKGVHDQDVETTKVTLQDLKDVIKAFEKAFPKAKAENVNVLFEGGLTSQPVRSVIYDADAKEPHLMLLTSNQL